VDFDCSEADSFYHFSNVDFLALFYMEYCKRTQLYCIFFAYFVLRMNQKASNSRVEPHGYGDAIYLINGRLCCNG